MDQDRPGRTTPFRRDLVLGFAALIVGIVGALAYLLGGGGSDAAYVQALLAVFLVGLAALIYTAVFVRNA